MCIRTPEMVELQASGAWSNAFGELDLMLRTDWWLLLLDDWFYAGAVTGDDMDTSWSSVLGVLIVLGVKPYV